MTNTSERVRSLWEAKASAYDRSPAHNPTSAIELAAWRGAMRRLLPSPPARVLDVGAGTGFLSLLLAGQGYQVTALDASSQMLARLREKAESTGLTLEIVEGDALAPPKDGFDFVVERHVLWTLPKPAEALVAWRQAAPQGRLVLFAAQWGTANGVLAAARSRARAVLRDLRHQGCPSSTGYDSSLQSGLPLVHGTSPEVLVSLVGQSDWGPAEIVRLPDIDWATRQAYPSAIDRLFGVPPSFAVTAGN
jgi:SAM-dependent methyltransferase